MKGILLLLSMVFFLSFKLPTDKVCCSNTKGARCTGSTFCTACSNCSGCKYCNAGGTCGVCTPKNKKAATTQLNASGHNKNNTSNLNTGTELNSGQCRATTKKGSRCSRSSRSGGYCWQHGG